MANDDRKIIPDPDNVPVRHVTGIVSNVFNGQTIAMTLVTDRLAVDATGACTPDLIIAARLRFDLNVAKRIRDQLDAYLKALEMPPAAGGKAN